MLAGENRDVNCDMCKFLNRPKSVFLILSLVFLQIILFGCGKQARLNPPLSSNKIRINDVSQLNPTDVSQITNATQVKDLQRAIRLAKDKGLKISIAGKRHSQGGHAFYDNAVVLNMENFDQIFRDRGPFSLEMVHIQSVRLL